MKQKDNSNRFFARLRRPNHKVIRRRARRIEATARRHAHRFIASRWENARLVRREALSWLVLVGVLLGLSGAQSMLFQSSYSQAAGVPGGTYAEGVLGPLDSFNPLFVQTSAERSASRLVFASLLSYDRWGELRGDLAQSWQVADGGKSYRVTLRDNITWHDGAPVTADDVIYTINTIQNPLTRSPLYGSWRDVVISKAGDRQVVFTLPSVYAPFPHALTFGVLPRHILDETPPEQIRESSFGRDPVGSGPFTVQNLQIIDLEHGEIVLHLAAFDRYFRGRPALDRFQLHAYETRADIQQAFLSGEVNAATDLDSETTDSIHTARPEALVMDTPLHNGVYALFRTDSGPASDPAVRRALRLAIDRAKVRDIAGRVAPLDGPLVPQLLQTDVSQPTVNATRAAQLLDRAGWKRKGETRQKGSQPLALSLVAPSSGVYGDVVNYLAEQWRALGVQATVRLIDPQEFQQSALLPRAYDVLVYELAIGGDPDVYAYWHSSQSNPTGFNLSNYTSGIVDDTLSSARSRVEPELRQAKYESFVEQWAEDAPAIALYQSTLHYVATSTTRAYQSTDALVDPVSRYHDIELWTVDRAKLRLTP